MIFFSYSSADRERVRPIRDALVALGFEVFWDQAVPAGLDWDTWIRQHLHKADCPVAFWSTASILSRNVRHEAMIAEEQNKLISVLLDPLTREQFPLGLSPGQAANLADWNGDLNHTEWRKFTVKIEARLTPPPWVRTRMDELEAQLVDERARREMLERRDNKLASEAEEAAYQQLRRQSDEIYEEAREKQKLNLQDKPLPLMKANKVFICYWREDSAGSAGRVKDRLELVFGEDLLFMDVDTIPFSCQRRQGEGGDQAGDQGGDCRRWR
jgi:hypothetical protein